MNRDYPLCRIGFEQAKMVSRNMEKLTKIALWHQILTKQASGFTGPHP